MRVAPYIAAWLIAFTGFAAAQTVGVTSAVNQSAVGLAPAAKAKTIYLGEEIIHNEKITTDSKGLLQILLADGTSFTVGPNSSMSIDSFVYDPDAGSAKVVASLGKGVFRFIGGKSSKSPDGVTLNTPVGTVGVRGGISNLDFSGATAYHVDMIYGDGITLKDGTKIIGDIYHSGYSIVIGTDGKTSVVQTPPEWAAQFQTLMAGQGGGSSDTSKQVADNVKKSDQGSSPGSSPGNGGTPSTAAGNIADDAKLSLLATWAQIDNSELAGVTARYDGKYSADVSYQSDEHRDLSEIPTSISNAPFRLVYSFGPRTGTAYFGEVNTDDIESDPALAMPVTADSLTGSGLATFSHAGTFDPIGVGSGTGTLSGTFLNTSGGIGRGVAGSFDAQITGGEDGTYHMTGAFSGDYAGKVPN